MKTIKQIADEIGVSKQAIHKKIKKEPLATTLQEFISTVDGVVYIEVDGECLIKSTFTQKSSSTESQIDVELSSTAEELPPTVDSTVDNIATDYINSLKEQISSLTADKSNLQQQLTEEKEYSRGQTDRISAQSERIADLAEKLAELTRNSQILLKQEQDKNTFILPEQQPTVSSEPATPSMKIKHRPFWQFWKK